MDISEISFQTQNENQILEMLRTYGNFQNIESFLSYLESFEEEENAKDQLYEKTIDSIESLDNKKLSESIINLTVKESHDLVTKSESLVNAVQDKLKIFLSDIDKTIESKSSIKQPEVKVKESEKLKRNSGTTSSKKKTLKNISNLTLNNYCGSIILKNISNLTINTCKQKPVDVPACNEVKSCDPVFYPQCDFYEKLISENEVLKRSIVNQSVKCTTYPDMISQVCMSPSKSTEKDDATYSITSASSIESDDKKDLSEIVKGRSSIEAHMGEAFNSHPPMIQCWLSTMYTETETEQENNIEILEFSKIA